MPGAAAAVTEPVWRRWDCLGEAGVNLVTPSFYCEGLSIDQCVGSFFACRFDYSAKSLAGDVHFLGRLLLV